MQYTLGKGFPRRSMYTKIKLGPFWNFNNLAKYVSLNFLSSQSLNQYNNVSLWSVSWDTFGVFFFFFFFVVALKTDI